MKRIFKQSLSTALGSWTTLLLFELFYKVVIYTIVYSISRGILNFILQAAGLSYLSFENLHLVFTNPLCICLLLILLILITITTFFEISALYFYCEKGWRHERLTVWQLIKHTVQSCSRLLHIKILIFFWGFMLTVLVAATPFSKYVLGWIQIPEFIMEFITQNKLLFFLFAAVLILLNCIFFLYLFALPSVILYKEKAGASWKKSLHFLKGCKIRTLGRIIFSFAAFFAVIIIIAALALLGLAAYTKLIYPPLEAEAMFRFLYKNWSGIGIIIAGTIGTIWLFSIIMVLFHQYKHDSRPGPAKTGKSFLHFVKRGAIIIATIVLLTMFSETELGGNSFYQERFAAQIIAHRAGGTFAPENTISALHNAMEDKADAAEIDVQQLKDGTLVIMHDSNFKRTTGNNKNVWEVTYPEVKRYDAGSYFSADFAGEPIPTLEDMLKNAKNKINLMIELKLTGHEKEGSLEKQTLDLIQKYDMLGQCSIASMNLEILEKVKKLEPQIETVYITPLLYSQSFAIDYIDGYSVETTSLSREMANTIKAQGKKVYGWTANSEDSIDANLRYQTDGVITDNAPLVDYYVKSIHTSLSLDSLTNILFPK